jgi:hypothetical protein
MKKIWKFHCDIQDGSILISMPDGAEIITVQMQHGGPCIWAIVDDTSTWVYRRFRWVGTGHPMGDDPMRHVGTVQLEGGVLVFHLFELLPATPTLRHDNGPGAVEGG